MTNKNIYYNPNPFKKEVGDCVVRALCKATERSWKDVYLELCSLGLELGDMPSGDETWKAYLIKNGFSYVPCKVKKGQKRPKVNNIKIPKGQPAVLRVSNHLVTIVDNKFYDLWDSGECSVYGYWIKEEK